MTRCAHDRRGRCLRRRGTGGGPRPRRRRSGCRAGGRDRAGPGAGGRALVRHARHRCRGARGGALVGAAAAIGADLAVALRDDRRPLASVSAVLGLAMLAALLHQLIRRDGRERLTDSLTATVSLAVVGCAGQLLSRHAVEPGRRGVRRGRRRGGRSCRGRLLLCRCPRLVGAGAGLVAGVASGVVVGLLSDLGARSGGLVALGCAGAAAVAAALARRAARPDPLVTAGLPLLLAAPVAFVLARLWPPDRPRVPPASRNARPRRPGWPRRDWLRDRRACRGARRGHRGRALAARLGAPADARPARHGRRTPAGS